MSWYEALGGTDRSQFSGALSISSVGVARVGETLELKHGGWRAAVTMLDPELTQFFASRNVIAVGSSTASS